MNEDFAAALQSVGEPPCTRCLWYQRCRDERMACWDFRAWVATGDATRRDKRGRIKPRNRRPRHKLYLGLFEMEKA